MTPIVRAAALWLMLGASAASPDDDARSGYAFGLPLPLGAAAPVQRFEVPAAVLIRSQTAGLGDLRVFDADGRSLPMALLPITARQRAETRLTALPILGAPGELTVTGVGLRIDPEGRSRVVRIDGQLEASGASAVVLGALFDTRAVAAPATALLLDADMPAQQPVTFVIEASRDLQDWRPVAQQVIYRRAADEVIAPLRLGDGDLAGRYLRLTWRAGSRLLSPVVIRAATLVTSRTTGAARPLAVLTDARLLDPHDLRFELPFATRLALLRIVPPLRAVVPVRILGRDDREQPWTAIGEGTAYRIERGGADEIGRPIALGSRQFRSLRVEADRRTAGFVTMPALELGFEPVQVAVLVTGRPPYTLHVGREKAAPGFLPLTALLPGHRTGAALDLPQVGLASPPRLASIASASSDSEAGSRRIMLWGVLIGGTLVLAALVWMLLRKQRPSA